MAETKTERSIDFWSYVLFGVFINFGHADPPIKMQRVWLNDIEAYTGIAAVDAYRTLYTYIGTLLPNYRRGFLLTSSIFFLIVSCVFLSRSFLKTHPLLCKNQLKRHQVFIIKCDFMRPLLFYALGCSCFKSNKPSLIAYQAFT